MSEREQASVRREAEATHDRQPGRLAEPGATFTWGGVSRALSRTIANPGRATPADILALQRTVGNQAVQRLLGVRDQPLDQAHRAGGRSASTDMQPAGQAVSGAVRPSSAPGMVIQRVNDHTKMDPPGAVPPLARYDATSSRGNLRHYCRDSTGKIWFWSEAGNGFWNAQRNQDAAAKLEQEVHNKKQTKYNAKPGKYHPYTKPGRPANEPGFDDASIRIGGAKSISGNRIKISEVKGKYTGKSGYYSYSANTTSEQNKFSATTDNLIKNLEKERDGLSPDEQSDFDMTVMNGDVSFTYFTNKDAKISSATLRNLDSDIRDNFSEYLQEEYEIDAADAEQAKANLIIKDRKVEDY